MPSSTSDISEPVSASQSTLCLKSLKKLPSLSHLGKDSKRGCGRGRKKALSMATCTTKGIDYYLKINKRENETVIQDLEIENDTEDSFVEVFKTYKSVSSSNSSQGKEICSQEFGNKEHNIAVDNSTDYVSHQAVISSHLSQIDELGTGLLFTNDSQEESETDSKASGESESNHLFGNLKFTNVEQQFKADKQSSVISDTNTALVHLASINIYQSCPLCVKTFDSNQSSMFVAHIKSCAIKNKISTQQLLNALELQKKQTAERMSLGLPIINKNSNKQLPKRHFTRKGATMDSNLELAIALSASMRDAEEERAIQEIEVLLEAGLEDEASKQRTQLESYGFSVSKSKGSLVPQKSGCRNKVTRNTLLFTRTQEDRERIITEKVAIILMVDDNETNQGSEEDNMFFKTTTAKSKFLNRYNDTNTTLWNKSYAVDNDESYYITDLSNFVLPCKMENGSKLQHISQIPCRMPTPEKFCIVDNNWENVDDVLDNELEKFAKNNSVKKNLELGFAQMKKSNQFEDKNLSNDWKFILGKKNMSDITIYVKNEVEIPCHELVLFVRCGKILQDVIRETDGTKTNKIILWMDYSYAAVLVFLEYLYTGTISKLPDTQNGDITDVKELSARYDNADLLNYLQSLGDEENGNLFAANDVNDTENVHKVLPLLSNDVQSLNNDYIIEDSDATENINLLQRELQTYPRSRSPDLFVSSDDESVSENQILTNHNRGSGISAIVSEADYCSFKRKSVSPVKDERLMKRNKVCISPVGIIFVTDTNISKNCSPDSGVEIAAHVKSIDKSSTREEETYSICNIHEENKMCDKTCEYESLRRMVTKQNDLSDISTCIDLTESEDDNINFADSKQVQYSEKSENHSMSEISDKFVLKCCEVEEDQFSLPNSDYTAADGGDEFEENNTADMEERNNFIFDGNVVRLSNVNKDEVQVSALTRDNFNNTAQTCDHSPYISPVWDGFDDLHHFDNYEYDYCSILEGNKPDLSPVKQSSEILEIDNPIDSVSEIITATSTEEVTGIEEYMSRKKENYLENSEDELKFSRNNFNVNVSRSDLELLNDSFSFDESILNKLERKNVVASSSSSSKQTPVSVRKFKCRSKSDTFTTPLMQHSTIKDEVTPLANYSVMKTPALKKELEKYGLKPGLSRNKAKLLLRHIYNELHPYVSDHESSHSSMKNDVKNNGDISKEKSGNVNDSPSSVINLDSDDESDLSLSQCSVDLGIRRKVDEECFTDDEDILEPCSQTTSVSTDIGSGMKKLLKSDSLLHKKILLYEPIYIESLKKKLTENGCKCKLNDLMNYLDEQCITFRSINQRLGRQKAKKKDKGSKYCSQQKLIF